MDCVLRETLGLIEVGEDWDVLCLSVFSIQFIIEGTNRKFLSLLQYLASHLYFVSERLSHKPCLYILSLSCQRVQEMSLLC